MADDFREPTRVEIVIDTDDPDPDPDLLCIWVAARAIKLVEQLRSNGFPAELVKIEIDGERHYYW